jgi:hypothetical protein
MKVGIVDAAFHADREKWGDLTLDWRRGAAGADHAGVPDFKWQKDAMVLCYMDNGHHRTERYWTRSCACPAWILRLPAVCSDGPDIVAPIQ